MPDAIAITPLHILYLVGVIVILAVMVLRRDTPAVCIAFLFLLGVVGLGNVAGGVQVVFKAILYAATQFMEVIATIALVTALSKCLTDLGSDYLLMTPMARVMKTPALTWWILGFAMLLFSLFLWPSPSVALVGAIMLPFAVKTGLNPLLAAMSMNLFGHGIALSYDLVIQGAPAISAGAAGIETTAILSEGKYLFWIMGIVTVGTAFLLNRSQMRADAGNGAETGKTVSALKTVPALETVPGLETVPAPETAHAPETVPGPETVPSPETAHAPETVPALETAAANAVNAADAKNHPTPAKQTSSPAPKSSRPRPSRPAVILAVLTPLAFLADILFMVFFHVNGGEATSMVSGTAVILMCAGAFLGFGRDCLERITDYLTDGFLFAIRIFAPVVVIGAFFFLGGEGISTIMGTAETSGIMTDWAVWLAHHAPLNKYMAAALELIVGGLTGLDGSGFSGLPLTGSLAATFGSAVGASVPVLASLGQIAAIFVGGGTIVPWGIIPVAAICGVSPMELARKNFIPVCLGFAAVFILACFLL